MITKLGLRLLILLGLLLPFLLRETSNSLEPYPAVLQPSGATILSAADGLLRFRRTELIAISGDGTEHLLDPKEFFAPIPGQYWTHIARNSFGLGQPKQQRVSLGIWTLSVATLLKASPADRKIAIDWINNRLTVLGIPDVEKLQVRQVKVFFDLDNRAAVKSEITEQTNVELR